MKNICLTMFILILLLSPLNVIAQNTEDIAVPPGYKVYKIADSNRIYRPAGLVFDSSGDILVAGYRAQKIYKIDFRGDVEVKFDLKYLDIEPLGITTDPNGDYIIHARNKVCKFIASDTLIPLFEHPWIMSIGYDRLGNFFAVTFAESPPYGRLIRFDSSYEVDDVLMDYLAMPGSITFDSLNNLYFTGLYNHRIWKIPAGDNGVCGSEDTAIELVPSIERPAFISIDEFDNLYVTANRYFVIDGSSSYCFEHLLKIDSITGVISTISENIMHVRGIVYKDGFIFYTDEQRGVVTRVEISTGIKSDVTYHTGLHEPEGIIFDEDNHLYVIDVYGQRLLRLMENEKYEQVGPGIGYCLTIVSHNNKLYLGSMDAIENRYHILELDPYSEELRVVGTDYPSWENITLDSFGRLILNSLKTDGTYELKIINYNSGESTPYVEGIHLNRLGIAFDSDQNLYAKEGETEGIKKVHLEEHYDPPLDISNEPLFYDFSSMPGLVNRDFFDVNSQQEIFIPVRDTGEIVRGDMYGNLEVFATGFSRPVHAKFIEEHGALYITDWGNGIFKISAPDWLLPNIDFVIADVENCEIDQGIKNSLIIKLDKASNSIRDGKINAAIGQIQAFQHLVLAQIGHKIPIDLADSWIAKTNDILVVLSDY